MINEEIKNNIEGTINEVVDKFHEYDILTPQMLFSIYKERNESEVENFKKDWFAFGLNRDLSFFELKPISIIEDIVLDKMIELNLLIKDESRAEDFYSHWTEISEARKKEVVSVTNVANKESLEVLDYIINEVNIRLDDFIPFKRTLENYARNSRYSLNDIVDTLLDVESNIGNEDMIEYFTEIGLIAAYGNNVVWSYWKETKEGTTKQQENFSNWLQSV